MAYTSAALSHCSVGRVIDRRSDAAHVQLEDYGNGISVQFTTAAKCLNRLPTGVTA